jgi:hypothetical protein
MSRQWLYTGFFGEVGIDIMGNSTKGSFILEVVNFTVMVTFFCKEPTIAPVTPNKTPPVKELSPAWWDNKSTATTSPVLCRENRW